MAPKKAGVIQILTLLYMNSNPCGEITLMEYQKCILGETKYKKGSIVLISYCNKNCLVIDAFGFNNKYLLYDCSENLIFYAAEKEIKSLSEKTLLTERIPKDIADSISKL